MQVISIRCRYTVCLVVSWQLWYQILTRVTHYRKAIRQLHNSPTRVPPLSAYGSNFPTVLWTISRNSTTNFETRTILYLVDILNLCIDKSCEIDWLQVATTIMEIFEVWCQIALFCETQLETREQKAHFKNTARSWSTSVGIEQLPVHNLLNCRSDSVLLMLPKKL